MQWGLNGPWGLENGVFDMYSGPANINVPITFTYGTPFYLMFFLGTFVGTPIAIRR